MICTDVKNSDLTEKLELRLKLKVKAVLLQASFHCTKRALLPGRLLKITCQSVCYRTCPRSYFHLFNILCSQVDDCAADWYSVTVMSIIERFLHEWINNQTEKSAQFTCFTGLTCQPLHTAHWGCRETALNQIRPNRIPVVIKLTISQTHANICWVLHRKEWWEQLWSVTVELSGGVWA